MPRHIVVEQRLQILSPVGINSYSQSTTKLLVHPLSLTTNNENYGPLRNLGTYVGYHSAQKTQI